MVCVSFSLFVKDTLNLLSRPYTLHIYSERFTKSPGTAENISTDIILFFVLVVVFLLTHSSDEVRGNFHCLHDDGDEDDC